MLEAHSAAIARELEDLILVGRLRLHEQSPGGTHHTLADGDWNLFGLYTDGLPHIGALTEAPVTARVLCSMGDAISNPRGNIYFSVLQPGVHVKAHWGPTNTRIRLQLALHVPAGGTLRVGTETRTWEEGKCLVFDDSWEHEAENPSNRPRSVLIVDVWHPDLSDEQRDALRVGEAEPVHPSGRGWVRRANEGIADACPAPIDPTIFTILNADRVAQLASTATKAFGLGFAAVTEATSRVLRILAANPKDAAVIEQEVAGAADEVIWSELASLASNAVAYDLQPHELVDLASLCSVSWRTWPGHVELMTEFLADWPAADLASCVSELVALGSVPKMISALSTLELPCPPPFGALVPLLSAAHRRLFGREREEQP